MRIFDSYNCEVTPLLLVTGAFGKCHCPLELVLACQVIIDCDIVKYLETRGLASWTHQLFKWAQKDLGSMQAIDPLPNSPNYSAAY